VGVSNSAAAAIARYTTPTVVAIGRAVGDCVGGVDTKATASVASASGALEETLSAIAAGDEMVPALSGAVAEGTLPASARVVEAAEIGAFTGNMLALVGERVGLPEGCDDGLSEGHNERY